MRIVVCDHGSVLDQVVEQRHDKRVLHRLADVDAIIDHSDPGTHSRRLGTAHLLS